MHRDARRGFLLRRRPKQVQAQIVPHDAREQSALRVLTVLGMAGRVVGTGFDRGPRRNPKRTHAARLVKYFRDMSALHGNSYTERVIFDLDGAAIVEAGLIHSVVFRVITWF